MKPEFHPQISENTQLQNFTKTRLMIPELLHTGGRTDRQTDRYEEDKSSFSLICERA